MWLGCVSAYFPHGRGQGNPRFYTLTKHGIEAPIYNIVAIELFELFKFRCRLIELSVEELKIKPIHFVIVVTLTVRVVEVNIEVKPGLILDLA